MFTLDDMPDLRGTTAVVTGANSGLGLETARALAVAGATVVMTARSREKYDAAAATIRQTSHGADISFAQMDLADLASVRDAARTITAAHPAIDILVNNAGIMLTPEATTADGLELQLGTNHFGHFAFTGLLLDALLRAGEARVVTVSSNAHHLGVMDFDDLHQQGSGRYRSVAAYGRSKLANLMFTLELQRRIEAADSPQRPVRARSVAAHPGHTATNLQTAGAGLAGGGLFFKTSAAVMRVLNPWVGAPVERGALPQIHAAVSDVPGGSYWGPLKRRDARGAVGPAAINAKAQDSETARRLWDVSVQTTGVDYAALRPADAAGHDVTAGEGTTDGASTS